MCAVGDGAEEEKRRRGGMEAGDASKRRGRSGPRQRSYPGTDPKEESATGLSAKSVPNTGNRT